MISVEQEEKIIKKLPLLWVITILPMYLFIKNETIKLAIIAPIVVLMSILMWRKYKRDSKEGKDTRRFKSFFIFGIVSILIAAYFVFIGL